jgi:hypothetical protein
VRLIEDPAPLGAAHTLRSVPRPDEVARIAREARTLWGVEGRRALDPWALCDDHGVDVEEEDFGEGCLEALLMPRGASFAIVYDPTPFELDARRGTERWRRARAQKGRFLLLHEVAHTFFYGLHGGEIKRHVMGSEAQERFCDEAATAWCRWRGLPPWMRPARYGPRLF